MGLGQLLPELGVVAPLLDEFLVILQRGLEELPAQPTVIEGVLLLEQRILADAGEVIATACLAMWKFVCARRGPRPRGDGPARRRPCRRSRPG